MPTYTVVTFFGPGIDDLIIKFYSLKFNAISEDPATRKFQLRALASLIARFRYSDPAFGGVGWGGGGADNVELVGPQNPFERVESWLPRRKNLTRIPLEPSNAPSRIDTKAHPETQWGAFVGRSYEMAIRKSDHN